jgi:hypothetical protein
MRFLHSVCLILFIVLFFFVYYSTDLATHQFGCVFLNPLLQTLNEQVRREAKDDSGKQVL